MSLVIGKPPIGNVALPLKVMEPPPLSFAPMPSGFEQQMQTSTFASVLILTSLTNLKLFNLDDSALRAEFRIDELNGNFLHLSSKSSGSQSQIFGGSKLNGGVNGPGVFKIT